MEPVKSKTTNEVIDSPHFKAVSYKEASTFDSFCSYHDTQLFRALDNCDASNLDSFLIQLYYRTCCFELYRKRAIMNGTSVLRTLDRGFDAFSQANWQTKVSIDLKFHYLSWQMHDKLRAELEPSVLGREHMELKYIHVETDLRMDLAGVGCFQPSMSWQGEKLQIVNWARLEDGKLFKDPLETVAIYCIPQASKTFLGLVCQSNDKQATKFLESIASRGNEIVSDIVAALILHSENVYYSGSFSKNINIIQRSKIFQLAETGIGEDIGESDITNAKSLGLYHKLLPVVWKTNVV
jgi:hypothetical protein